MNLFCDLTVTDHPLVIKVLGAPANTCPATITINAQTSAQVTIDLLDSLHIKVKNFWIESILVDDINVTDYLPRQLDAEHEIEIREPFYRWWHARSGQGWLLYPRNLG